MDSQIGLVMKQLILFVTYFNLLLLSFLFFCLAVSAAELLFAEELGPILEVDASLEKFVIDAYGTAGVSCKRIGSSLSQCSTVSTSLKLFGVFICN